MARIIGPDPFSTLARRLMRGARSASTTTVPSMLDILAHRILNNAKRRAPVLTGALRASGRVEAGDSPNRRVIAFGGGFTGVEYAKAVEYGRYSRAPAPPQPYLRPALIEEMRAGREDLRNVLQKSIDDMAAGRGP